MPNDQLNKIQQELDALKAEFYRGNFSSSRDETKYVRFKSRIKLPVYASAPATCEVGELHVISSTGKVYVCSASNVWSLIGTQS